jgi:ribosome-associated protein
MDYGDVIIHIFLEPMRSFYDLEGLWSDAKRITTKALTAYNQQEPSDEM